MPQQVRADLTAEVRLLVFRVRIAGEGYAPHRTTNYHHRHRRYVTLSDISFVGEPNPSRFGFFVGSASGISE